MSRFWWGGSLCILVPFLIVGLVIPAFAELESQLFEQANELYRTGEFEQAAEHYEKIVTAGFSASELFYNLGNTYYKLGNIPAAILNFERARKLAPNDQDVQHNLQLARTLIVDQIDALPEFFLSQWWRSLIELAPSTTWAGLAIALFWCCIIFFAFMMALRKAAARKGFFMLGALSFVLSLLVFFIAFQQNEAETNSQHAIIFQPSVYVKSEPDAQSTDLFILHEGTRVELGSDNGEWRRITIASGESGWIPADALREI